MNTNIKVISISSVSGGGKTTIVNYLLKSLKNSVALFFDDYEFINFPDVINWIETGADYNTFNIDPFVDDIKIKINDRNIKYILLDYPFSYLNKKCGQCIDFSIFIDTPLDIAMARRFIRDFNNITLKKYYKEMQFYLLKGKEGYYEMLKSVKPNADIIINGNNSIENIGNEIINKIRLTTAST